MSKVKKQNSKATPSDSQNDRGVDEIASEPKFIQTLVVGAGPAGLHAACRLQRQYPAMQILILEAEDRSQGRSQLGLHLIEESKGHRLGLGLGETSFGPLRVRWEREWLDAEQVPWGHKDWAVGLIPQVKNLCQAGPWRSVENLPESDVAVAVKTRSPVRSLRRLADASQYFWEVKTPTQTYLVEKIVWSAGMVAFQNAMGKQETQAFCTGNPLYTKDAADFKGGVALDLTFEGPVEFEEKLPRNAILGIPVRFESKLYLAVGMLLGGSEVSGSGARFRVYMNLPEEIWVEPKTVSSLQKALRRTLLNLTVSVGGGDSLPKSHEKWVVASRIMGSSLGNPWVFSTQQSEPGISFVGDEAESAARLGLTDLAAALDSVNQWVEAAPGEHPEVSTP